MESNTLNSPSCCMALNGLVKSNTTTRHNNKENYADPPPTETSAAATTKKTSFVVHHHRENQEIHENHHNHGTVRFDVGGTIYKVSRSLVEQYPNTLLYRLISSKTRNIDPDSKPPIFIDRNGDRFQYVLDYMRDKEVHLPLSVSKAATIRDLHYYGFVDDHSDSSFHRCIHDGCASAEAATQIAKCEALYQQELERCRYTVRKYTLKMTYLNVAHACFLQYSKTGILSDVYLGDYSLNLITLQEDINDAFRNLDKDLFDECLSLHGLKYVSHRSIKDHLLQRSFKNNNNNNNNNTNNSSIWYYVSLKALPSSQHQHQHQPPPPPPLLRPSSPPSSRRRNRK